MRARYVRHEAWVAKARGVPIENEIERRSPARGPLVPENIIASENEMVQQ